MRKHLLLALACAATLPAAQAQTGRIARLSHGGRVAENEDNFGTPPSWIRNREEELVDSVVCLNDTVATVYQRSRFLPYNMKEAEARKVPWQRSQVNKQYYAKRYQHSWEVAVRYLAGGYPRAKMVGFDKQRLRRTKYKPSGRTPSFHKRPFQYSYWRGLATVATLGAVGWRLGKKRSA